MKYLFLVIAFVACNGNKKSEIKFEKGIVFEKSYTAPQNNSSIGLGMSSNGDPVMTVNNSHVQEQHIVFFRCEHQTVFSIDRKDLWLNLNRNDSVVISYKEIINHKGKVVDYEFINANKK